MIGPIPSHKMTRWWPSSWGRKRSRSDDDELEIDGMNTESVGATNPFAYEASSSQAKLGEVHDESTDPELAISPKSIQLLEEAEIRAHHRSRRRK